MTKPSDMALTHREYLNKVSKTPHAKKLKLALISSEDNSVTLKLPFSDEIIGDPINRIVHGGAISSLVDTACGAAVFLTQNNLRAFATLDLRIDHIRAANSGEDIYATAECYRLTHTIAFVRATVFTDNISNPIAASIATFMRSNKQFPVN